MADLVPLTPLEGFGIATVMARKGVPAAAIEAALGHSLPQGPATIVAGPRTVLGSGPNTWLVFEQDAAVDFGEDLARRLAGLASVSDQSGSYVVHGAAGPRARTLMQRGLAIDLDPPAFAPGSAAISQIAHVGVVLWQVDDVPTYRIAIFRSYAGALRHWWDVTAAGLAY